MNVLRFMSYLFWFVTRIRQTVVYALQYAKKSSSIVKSIMAQFLVSKYYLC